MGTVVQTNGRGSAQMTDSASPPFGAGHALGAVIGETERRQRVEPILPKTMGEMQQLAEMIARAGWAPKSYLNKTDDWGSGYSVDKIFIGIYHGSEVGLTPLASLQAIAVINGTPCLWGDGALAVVIASGALEDHEETQEIDDKGDVVMATCRVKRKGRPTETIRTFGRADAQKAGLWNKRGPWEGYKRRMCQMRARSWALRDTFADVLKGLKIVEEMVDAVDVDTLIASTAVEATRHPARPETKTVSPAAFQDALKKPTDPAELYPLFDQHGDKLCDYTNPAEWVAGLVMAAEKPAGRAFVLENNRAIAEQIANAHADCAVNLDPLYEEQVDGDAPGSTADATPQTFGEIDFERPQDTGTAPSREAKPDAPPPQVEKPAQRKAAPSLDIGTYPTWLSFVSKMQAEIIAAPDADYVTELMQTNKDRIAGGPPKQQQDLRTLAAKQWRDLGGKHGDQS